MKRIILDTNALLAITQFKLDIFSTLERQIDDKYALFVLDKIQKELEKLIKESRLSEKKAAKLALALITHKNVEVIKTPENGLTVDEELLRMKGYAVLTQDAELKRQLKEQGIEVLTIRQKKKISQA